MRQRCRWAEGRSVCAPDSTGPSLLLSVRSDGEGGRQCTESFLMSIIEALGMSSQIFWTMEISRNVVFCGISIYRLFQALHTLILSMFASTRSWSTSFCAWTTLLLLHIFPDIAFNIYEDSKLLHYSSSTAVRATRKLCVLPDPSSQRGWAGGSGEEVRLSFPAYTPLYIHSWGQFKGSVILKVIQCSAGNVTDITHHFTATTDEKINVIVLCL